MKIEDLNNGDILRARFARYRDGTNGPEWSFWQRTKFYIQRHHGKITIIAPQKTGWAEYQPRDFDNGVFECEGFYMEIEGLTT